MGDKYCFSVGKAAGAWSQSLTSVQYLVKEKGNYTSAVILHFLGMCGITLLKNVAQQIIVKELRCVVCYGMWRRVFLYVCSNPKIRPAYLGFSDVTIYLNASDVWSKGRWIETWNIYCEFCEQPDFYSVGILSSFPGIKRPERVADHSLLRSTEIMNEWSYAFSSSQPLWHDTRYFISCIE